MQAKEIWLTFLGHVEQEDENGITIVSQEGVRIRHKKGDYHITKKGVIKLRLGAKAEWFDPPQSCNLKK